MGFYKADFGVSEVRVWFFLFYLVAGGGGEFIAGVSVFLFDVFFIGSRWGLKEIIYISWSRVS